MQVRGALVGITVLIALARCGGDSFTEIVSDPPVLSDLTVRWLIEDENEQSLTCTEAQIETVMVAVGGEPIDVPCDDDGASAVVFTQLPVGRYPVVIRLLGIGDAVLSEHRENIELGEVPLTYTHTFVIDRTDTNRGALDVRWVLAGDDPRVACAAFGADRVVVTSEPESIEDLPPFELSCATGRLEIVDLRSGGYRLRFTLIDVDRVMLMGGVVVRDFRINPGQRSQDLFSFPLQPAEKATLRLEWTLNGRPAADECIAVGGEELRMELFQQNSPLEEISIRTASAACDLGVLIAPELNASANPEVLRFRVSAALRRFPGLVLTSTTIPDVRLTRGRTSTVSFDLQVE